MDLSQNISPPRAPCGAKNRIGEIGKLQLRKQMSMDDVGKERPSNDRGQRGYLTKQKSIDTNVLGRQQKMFQVNLVKQMSVQSLPDTPRVVRKALDKRLKKEQGMTILVGAHSF